MAGSPPEFRSNHGCAGVDAVPASADGQDPRRLRLEARLDCRDRGCRAEAIRQGGHDADCLEAGSVKSLDGYEAVVLGSAVYIKRWRGDAKHFLRRHAKTLAGMPFWVFSSGPTGDPADDDPEWLEPPKIMARAEELGVREHVVFGGRVSPEGGAMMRSMAENMPEELRDRRDWDEIRNWASGIADDLG